MSDAPIPRTANCLQKATVVDDVMARPPTTHKAIVVHIAIRLCEAVLSVLDDAPKGGEIGLVVSRKAAASPANW